MTRTATSSSGSAALAPIRRWVLYSPWRLGGVVTALVVVLFVIGHVTGGGSASRSSAGTAGGTAPSTTVRMLTAGQEVTADDAAGVTDLAQARKSPQLMAMKWALSYLDISATTGQWITQLTALAPTEGLVYGDFVSSRPTYPVTVTGTTSTAQGGRLVVVPTSVGDLTAHLDFDDHGWQITAPLPVLAGATLSTDPSTPSAAADDTTTPDTTTPTTVPAPSPAPSTTRVAPTTPAPAPTTTLPRPKPGPIPTPTLDGPLPA